jgi:2-amino-4-hydroxy-6-hydroxymethyldihydropteridine diphosphokinase
MCMFTLKNKIKHLFNKIMIVSILLGGNLGNRQAYLNFGKFLINRDLGSIIKESKIYETEAWGGKSDKAYLNQLVDIDFKGNPKELMLALLQIELKAGRKRWEKWGNRTLDIDILFWGDNIINEENLIIPHPALHNRKFALLPLMEWKAEFVHPVLQKKISYLLDICTDNLDVQIY